MTTPTYCTSCGHELGIGRFCTNCGKPVPGRHPEAPPPVGAPPAPPTVQVTPTVPPPAGAVPPAARYPLYADTPATVVVPLGPPPTAPPPGSAAPGPGGTRRGAPRWLPWAIGLVLLALVAGVGGFLLLGSGDDDGRAADAPDRRQVPSSGEPAGDTGAKPDSDGTGGPVEEPDGDDVEDLTGRAEAEVPAVAGPSRDRDNNPVDFEADNLLDGRPRTSWRMPGDGTGESLSFDLGDAVVLTEVGLINGYAKVDGPDNWYRGNRRVRAVQWEFDDGTRITQELVDQRTMQVVEIDAVETATVTLHLLAVSPPGTGPNGRDFTAISEVRFLGAG